MADFHEQLQAAITKVRGEMPDVATVPVAYDPTLSTAWAGQTRHDTGVTIGPGAAGGTSDALEGLMTHELTHARQQARQSWYEPFLKMFGPHFDYRQDPTELEAFQAASDRAIAHHQTPTAQPGFEGGFQRGDISLPKRTGVGNRYHP